MGGRRALMAGGDVQPVANTANTRDLARRARRGSQFLPQTLDGTTYLPQRATFIERRAPNRLQECIIGHGLPRSLKQIGKHSQLGRAEVQPPAAPESLSRRLIQD
jgi:hypothetical protein